MQKTSVRLLVVFIVTIILLTGCGGGSRSGFHPPAWIQGSWMIDTTTVVLFEFTPNNVIQYGGPSSLSFKDIYKDVDETITSTLYQFTINYGETTFNFSKVTDTSISFFITGGSPPLTLNKQL